MREAYGAGIRRALWYAPAAAWAAFLLYLSERDFAGPIVPYTFPWDKVAHLALYGVLAALAVYGWRKAGRWPHVLLPLTISLAVGALDELRQRAVASRTADPIDFLADVTAIALVFACLARRRRLKEVG